MRRAAVRFFRRQARNANKARRYLQRHDHVVVSLVTVRDQVLAPVLQASEMGLRGAAQMMERRVTFAHIRALGFELFYAVPRAHFNYLRFLEDDMFNEENVAHRAVVLWRERYQWYYRRGFWILVCGAMIWGATWGRDVKADTMLQRLQVLLMGAVFGAGVGATAGLLLPYAGPVFAGVLIMKAVE